MIRIPYKKLILNYIIFFCFSFLQFRSFYENIDVTGNAKMSAAPSLETSHSLLLNDEVVKKLTEQHRSLYIFEWLRYLDKNLLTAKKSEIKECQKKLVQQLTEQVNGTPGPPIRKLLANCLATLFSVGDTFLLFETVNTCNDILKNKDDSPSILQTKL